MSFGVTASVYIHDFVVAPEDSWKDAIVDFVVEKFETDNKEKDKDNKPLKKEDLEDCYDMIDGNVTKTFCKLGTVEIEAGGVSDEDFRIKHKT